MLLGNPNRIEKESENKILLKIITSFGIVVKLVQAPITTNNGIFILYQIFYTVIYVLTSLFYLDAAVISDVDKSGA